MALRSPIVVRSLRHAHQHDIHDADAADHQREHRDQPEARSSWPAKSGATSRESTERFCTSSSTLGRCLLLRICATSWVTFRNVFGSVRLRVQRHDKRITMMPDEWKRRRRGMRPNIGFPEVLDALVKDPDDREIHLARAILSSATGSPSANAVCARCSETRHTLLTVEESESSK